MYLLQFLILHDKTNSNVHFHESNVLQHDHRWQIRWKIRWKKVIRIGPSTLYFVSGKTASSRVIRMITDFHPSPQGFFTLNGLPCTLTIINSFGPLAPPAGWLWEFMTRFSRFLSEIYAQAWLPSLCLIHVVHNLVNSNTANVCFL